MRDICLSHLTVGSVAQWQSTSVSALCLHCGPMDNGYHF